VGRARPGRVYQRSWGCPLLIIEGDGAGRREVAYLIDALIWVQSDEREAGRRRLARDRNPDALDLANKPLGGAPLDHAGWMAEEIPFNAAQRTWDGPTSSIAVPRRSLAIRAPKSSSHHHAPPADDQQR
jgi:hypothetical protein